MVTNNRQMRYRKTKRLQKTLMELVICRKCFGEEATLGDVYMHLLKQWSDLRNQTKGEKNVRKK